MDWLENLRRSFLDWESMAEVLPKMIAVGLKNTIILAARLDRARHRSSA